MLFCLCQCWQIVLESKLSLRWKAKNPTLSSGMSLLRPIKMRPPTQNNNLLQPGNNWEKTSHVLLVRHNLGHFYKQGLDRMHSVLIHPSFKTWLTSNILGTCTCPFSNLLSYMIYFREKVIQKNLTLVAETQHGRKEL